MDRVAIAAALWLLPVPLCAQWLNFRTPGIPRTADGKPNLTAAAPRTPDGKPDLSGLWQNELNPYRFDLIQDLKDEAIFRPAAEALFLKRVADFRRDDPVTHCLPGGPAEILSGGLYRIMQSSTMVALLYEGGTGRYRQIFMDGRKLPDDPNPTWLGYSVGHWDGDTLVVESAGFNDRSWLDRAGRRPCRTCACRSPPRRRTQGSSSAQPHWRSTSGRTNFAEGPRMYGVSWAAPKRLP